MHAILNALERPRRRPVGFGVDRPTVVGDRPGLACNLAFPAMTRAVAVALHALWEMPNKRAKKVGSGSLGCVAVNVHPHAQVARLATGRAGRKLMSWGVDVRRRSQIVVGARRTRGSRPPAGTARAVRSRWIVVGQRDRAGQRRCIGRVLCLTAAGPQHAVVDDEGAERHQANNGHSDVDQDGATFVRQSSK